jgi:hypothetical protein
MWITIKYLGDGSFVLFQIVPYVNTFAKINNASYELNDAVVDLKKKSICSHTKTLSQFPLVNVL